MSDGVTWSYSYDANGNITAIYKDASLYESYTYDSLNQLTGITASNGDVYAYTYSNGNILTVSKNGTVINTYSYTDTNWTDKLTAFNCNDNGFATMALAVEKTDTNQYRANTIFTKEMAYEKARLLMKPESDWLVD